MSNFVRLVESGEYDPEEIRDEWSRGFVAGMGAAVEATEGFAHEYDDFDGHEEDGEIVGATPLHERVSNSVAREAVGEAARYLYTDYCTAIIAFLDDEACADEGGEAASDGRD